MSVIDYFRKLETRFWSQVNKTNGCWVWTGHKHIDGYGWFEIKNRQYLAHRVSYQLNIGKIPRHKLVCHRCDNPPCVNPKHLWVGTNQENVDDAKAKGIYRLAQKRAAKKRARKFQGSNVSILSNECDCGEC